MIHEGSGRTLPAALMYMLWIAPVREAEEGQAPTVGTLGPLEIAGPLERSGSAYLWEEGQGGQRGQEAVCIHGHPGGKGCYLCDPEHPHRLKGRSTA